MLYFCYAGLHYSFRVYLWPLQNIIMDYHIVTLEIADLITHFDYYDSLVSGTANLTDDTSAEQIKLRDKCAEHIAGFLPNETFYDLEKKLL